MNHFQPRKKIKGDDDGGGGGDASKDNSNNNRAAAKESDSLLLFKPSSSSSTATTIRSRRSSPIQQQQQLQQQTAAAAAASMNYNTTTTTTNPHNIKAATTTMMSSSINTAATASASGNHADSSATTAAAAAEAEHLHHHVGYQSIVTESQDDHYDDEGTERQQQHEHHHHNHRHNRNSSLHRFPLSESTTTASTSSVPQQQQQLPLHPPADAPSSRSSSSSSSSGNYSQNNNNNNSKTTRSTITAPAATTTPAAVHHHHHHRHHHRVGHHHHPDNNNNNNNNNNDEHHHNDDDDDDEATAPPLLEIPEEIYAVRKAALQVLKPLNKTWVVISVGFAMTVLFGMARWTRLLPRIPFWFIVLPCWSAHVGLLWLHVLSAKALSAFIAEANDSRQRPDSRDHLNRTEYLPLLQRSLKFGLKTGLLSFCVFAFEILIYIRVARGTISLGTAFLPLWLLVTVGIVDGLICKTQHVLRVVCWMLTFAAMLLTVLKVDYGYDAIRWRVVISPVVTVLSIASCSLIYIVYGHQIGYYRLTESQLTAGNLYSLAALICIVLIVMIGEVIPLSRPVEIETRLMVVILAPLVVSLVGMGAWVVSRDEFGRFLLYGGQSAVHPMKLKWEASGGWTSVQGKGVTVIPMFGEVSFQPLEKKPVEHAVEMINNCSFCCATCYPYEEEDEETTHLAFTSVDEYHPYLDPSPQQHQQQRSSYHTRRASGV